MHKKFSGCAFPTLRLDLAAGQGCAAKAALLERVPYYGFVLSDQHCKKLELLLTEFVLSQMKIEGTSHYRPEAVQEAAEDGADTSNTAGQSQKNKNPDAPNTQPKKKSRKTKKKDEDAQGEPADPATQEAEEEGAGSPLPW